MKKINQLVLPMKKPKSTPLQKLQPYFKPGAYAVALESLTCLGVTYAENLCAAWLEYVEKNWNARFREGLMQSLYELGVEEWLETKEEQEKKAKTKWNH
jgi:hypothetical protein